MQQLPIGKQTFVDIRNCGYTQEELEFYFSDHITALAASDPLGEHSTLLDKIRYWYNGYHFCENASGVYNPFSTLNLFDTKKFKDYWFESGTPKLLVDLIKHKHYNLEIADGADVSELNFTTYELERLEILPLLVQTGYLTIQAYDPEWRLYRLGFPNFEVKNSFLSYLLNAYTEEDALANNQLKTLIQTVQHRDIPSFFKTLKIFFAKIPYDIYLARTAREGEAQTWLGQFEGATLAPFNEKYYQSIFYMIFTLIGLKIAAEVRTNTGRIDATIETDDSLFLFEFKLDDTAQNALTQITEKDYAFPFSDSTKTIVKIGVSFSTKERNITEWITDTHGSR